MPSSEDGAGKGVREPRFMADRGTRGARTHRRFRELLRTLMHSADFTQSSQLIDLPKILSLSAKCFFFHLRASAAATGTFRGYGASYAVPWCLAQSLAQYQRLGDPHQCQ